VSQQINLFNPDFQKQKQYFSTLDMLISLALIVVGAGLFYGFAVYQLKQLDKLSVETDTRFVTEQARLTQFQAQYSPQQASTLLANELAVTLARASTQKNLIETLKSGVLGNTTGYSEYMRAFARQVVNGLWLTGFDITGDGAQMTMSGGVTTPELLPVYVQKLSQEKAMKGKSFAALQMQQPKAVLGKTAHYVEFTLQSVEDKPIEGKPNETRGQNQ
jgi:hypothetical protein